jgi:hypothetical protein
MTDSPETENKFPPVSGAWDTRRFSPRLWLAADALSYIAA